MEILVKKPYIALNLETYINIHQQELATCKRIAYKFYCEELFVVRHKSIHSCKSAIYFDLDTDIIKKICDFISTIINQILPLQCSMVVMK